jgi:hypothetical protein
MYTNGFMNSACPVTILHFHLSLLPSSFNSIREKKTVLCTGDLASFNTIQAQVSMKINQIWHVSPASHEFMTMKEESCFATTCSLHPKKLVIIGSNKICLPIRLIISSLIANVVHMYQTQPAHFCLYLPNPCLHGCYLQD